MNQDQLAIPPKAPRIHNQTTLHGVTLTDDYAWLRNKDNPDTVAYLEAENAYAEAVMAPEAALREQLYNEMLSHIKQTDVSVPYRDGQYWYYTRTEEGRQYGISCRKIGLSSGPSIKRPKKCCSTAMCWRRVPVFCRRRHRHQRRRPLAGLHHGHHRLPPVHAAHQGP